MTHASLFSGIGGFDLAAEWMGWDNMFHCEWGEFNQRILKYYWPKAESYGDITKTDFTIWNGRIDILTGGFPCQPYSLAGKRKGKEDERHLWPEMLRAIREIKPRWVVGENVYGLVNWNGGLVFNEVQTDLENQGYEVQAYILPACAKDAPHRRDRVWFVAYSNNSRNATLKSSANRNQPEDSQKWNFTQFKYYRHGFEWATANTKSPRQQSSENRPGEKQFGGDIATWYKFPTKPAVCGGNDGISRELDAITFPKWRTESIKSYGNAVVPQIPYEIFKIIELYEQLF